MSSTPARSRVGQRYHPYPPLRIEANKRAVAASAAVVPDDLIAVGGDDPGQSRLLSRRSRPGRRAAFLEHGRHGRSERRFRVAEIRREKSQHVIGVGAQCAGASESGQVPVRRLVHGACHDRRRGATALSGDRLIAVSAISSGTQNARAHESFVVHAGTARQDMAQQSAAQIGILKLRADVARQLVSRREIGRAGRPSSRRRDWRDRSA